MRKVLILVLVLTVGVAIVVLGNEGIKVLYAQSTTSPGYLIEEIDVHDPDTFRAYAAQVPATWVPVSKSEYEEEMAKIVMHVQSLGLFDKTEKKWLRWLQDLGFGSVEE